MSTLAFLALKVANTLIMSQSDHVFFWLSDSEDQKSLTHRWHSFPGWVNKRVTILFTYKNRQYNHFGKMWLCSGLFDENVRRQIVDTLMTLNLMTN